MCVCVKLCLSDFLNCSFLCPLKGINERKLVVFFATSTILCFTVCYNLRKKKLFMESIKSYKMHFVWFYGFHKWKKFAWNHTKWQKRNIWTSEPTFFGYFFKFPREKLGLYLGKLPSIPRFLLEKLNYVFFHSFHSWKKRTQNNFQCRK